MIWCKSDDGQYRVEMLSRKTFPGGLNVIKEAFCQDEAVSIATEINKNPAAAEELLELCADAALDGVSLIAIHNPTNEVVAASFNKLQVPSSSSAEKPFFEVFAEERCKESSSRALIQYMADVDGKCNLFEKLNVDCSLEIMFLATLKEHRLKGLGLLLSKCSVELARKLREGPVSKMTVADLGGKYSNMAARSVTEKCPQICQGIWTGPGTQKIGKILGFTVYLSMPFTEFEYNGKTFADTLGPGSFFELAAMFL